MRCISPIWIRPNVVPCGKCNFCLVSRRAAWTFRLIQENRVSSGSLFITLTLNDESLSLFDIVSHKPCINYEDVKNYLKRLRRTVGRYADVNLRYYACGEYGSDGRPHYHIVLFNLPASLGSLVVSKWGRGHVTYSRLNERRIGYTTKYHVNPLDSGDTRVPPDAWMSKGIGRSYLTPGVVRYHERGKILFVVNQMGSRSKLPRYYLDRLWPTVSEVVENSDGTFTQTTKPNKAYMEILSTPVKDQMLRDELKELRRLSKLHRDPVAHYYERVVHMHDNVRVKVNRFSQL